MKAKYINPYETFGFKRIFGEESSKPLLIDFLNSLLPPEDKIVNLTFRNAGQSEQTNRYPEEVGDIYCENEKGEKFIVEIQIEKWNYYIERTKYDSTFPIREQIEKGEWNPHFKVAYCIGILDFTFDDYPSEPDIGEIVHTFKLKNQNGNIFYEKLTYIYLEMPNFDDLKHEIKTRLDKWIYFIKNCEYLEDLDSEADFEEFETIPFFLHDEVFRLALKKAELSKIEPEKWDSYEQSLKIFRDKNAVFDYVIKKAYEEGRIHGIASVKTEIAMDMAVLMIKMHKSNKEIIQDTGLPEMLIRALRHENS